MTTIDKTEASSSATSQDKDSDDEMQSRLSNMSDHSLKKYQLAYDLFKAWKMNKNITETTEPVVVEYFEGLSKQHKASTLWSVRTRLKVMLKLQENINISTYFDLQNFIKSLGDRYADVRKAHVFTPGQIKQFLEEAPDDDFLPTKVALIMSILGTCQLKELYHMKMSCVNVQNTEIIVTYMQNRTGTLKTFAIKPPFYEIVRKYVGDRYPVHNVYVFQQYVRGAFTKLRTGMNSFLKMAKQVAKFLNIEDADMYEGHSFKRTASFIEMDADGNMYSTKLDREYRADFSQLQQEAPPVETAYDDCDVFVNSGESDCGDTSKGAESSKDLPDAKRQKKQPMIFNDCTGVTINIIC